MWKWFDVFVGCPHACIPLTDPLYYNAALFFIPRSSITTGMSWTWCRWSPWKNYLTFCCPTRSSSCILKPYLCLFVSVCLLVCGCVCLCVCLCVCGGVCGGLVGQPVFCMQKQFGKIHAFIVVHVNLIWSLLQSLSPPFWEAINHTAQPFLWKSSVNISFIIIVLIIYIQLFFGLIITIYNNSPRMSVVEADLFKQCIVPSFTSTVACLGSPRSASFCWISCRPYVER